MCGWALCKFRDFLIGALCKSCDFLEGYCVRCCIFLVAHNVYSVPLVSELFELCGFVY